jgi:F0F1-type ATP synthase assembly protein I
MPDDRPSNGPSAPIGFMIAGSEMVSFALLGLLLDYAFDTMPWLTIVLTLLGLVAAFLQLTRMAKALAARKGPGSGSPEPPQTGGGGAT